MPRIDRSHAIRSLSGLFRVGAAMGDQAIVSASNFLTFLIVTRLLQPEEVGTFALIFAGLVALNGMQNALIATPIKVLGVGSEGTEFINRQSVLLAFAVVPQALLFAVFSAWSLGLGAAGYVAAGLLVAVFQFHELARASQLSRLRPGDTLKLDLACYGIRFMALGLLIACSAFSLVGTLWCMVTGFLVWPLFLRSVRMTVGFSVAHFAKVWRFGRWLLVDAIAYFLSTHFYLYAIGALLTLEAIAAISAVQNLLSVLNVLFMGVAAYLLPLARVRLVDQGYDPWRRLIVFASTTVTGSMLIVVLGLCLIPSSSLAFVYGERYALYGNLLVFLAIPAALNGFNAIANVAFQTMERPAVGVLAKLLSAVFAVLWVYPGVSNYGIWGAAIGLAATPVIWALTFAGYMSFGALSRARIDAYLFSANRSP